MKARAQRLADLLPAARVDVMLVSDLVNLRYLTGFTGSNGLALIGPQTRTFITDFRYVEQAADQVHPSFARVRAPVDLYESIPQVLPDGELRLGFEDAHLAVRQFERLRELLPERVEPVPAGPLVEHLRVVKDPTEIAAIRAAAELADEAFEGVISEGLLGRTEREVAMALEWDMRERGAQRPSFETIVAAGPHGALPHAQPREVRIRRGDLVVIDWGAELDGYCSDCTRTVAAGEPGRAAEEIYDLVLEAQLAGLEATAAGQLGREVDATARELITSRGYGDRFGHGLGHGVGMEVHEAPRMGLRSSDQLQAGSIVTVEPGVYLPGQFGVRIEDLVVVREDRCEILTEVSKELIVTD